MTAEQELASKYGITIKRHKAGGYRLYAWTEQNGGCFAEAHPAAGSEAAELARKAIAARGDRAVA